MAFRWCLAAAAPWLVAAEECAADLGGTCDGPVEDDVSLLAHQVLQKKNQRHRSLNAEGASGSVAKDDIDLFQRNYAGREGLWCVGINAVGFDLDATGGRDGQYTQPSNESLKYFYDQGSNCFRLPITWERLVLTLGDDGIAAVPGVEETIDYITKTLGAYVIIDPHNNDQGLQFNGVNANREDFVHLWKAIAHTWGDNPRAIFGLYNEPRFGFENGMQDHFNPDALDFDGEQLRFWFRWMQDAIDVIREGGSSNLILVPGLHWTGSRDWSGAFWWGETIGGYTRGGNTRLAGLTDPKDMIAYDVHQYMDGRFTGESTGCPGHLESDFGGLGADWGLEQTIEWAKRFNKKLMMTEIASFPANDGTQMCQQQMCRYIQEMADSGVFIGYQVWQMGCPQCLGDQYSLRPYNLDWYRWDSYGRNGNGERSECGDGGGGRDCVAEGTDCREARCCSDPGLTCYEKDEFFASCRDACEPGLNPDDPPQFRTPWTCRALS